jgi:MFS family permease
MNCPIDMSKEIPTPDFHNNTTNPSTSSTNITHKSELDNVAKPPLSTTNNSTPAPPPNGGLQAWIQVACGFLLFFNTWGLTSTFSVFQTYYESGDLFTASSTEISWIGSIQAFLLQLTGLIAGPLYDRGYLRHLLITGSFLIVFGHMMLSLCTQYWQALLAQGFCVGIGAGLLFVPTVSLLPTWFSTRMGLAIGIASSGSSFGGIIYSIMVYRLISQIGFPWAVRCLGFIALVTLMLPIALFRMRVRGAKPRAVVDWSAFRDRPFMLFTLGLGISYIGQTVLLFYISFYPADRGITNTSLAFYITAIFNAGSVLGRILPNALSDRIGVFNTLVPLSMLFGVTIFCLLAVHDVGGMVVEALATGFGGGVAVALPPVCVRLLTENKAMVGTRAGQAFAIGGIGLLIGGPTAGAVLGNGELLNWTGLWVYGGVMTCVGGLLYAGARVMKSGFSLRIKA